MQQLWEVREEKKRKEWKKVRKESPAAAAPLAMPPTARGCGPLGLLQSPGGGHEQPTPPAQQACKQTNSQELQTKTAGKTPNWQQIGVAWGNLGMEKEEGVEFAT